MGVLRYPSTRTNPIFSSTSTSTYFKISPFVNTYFHKYFLHFPHTMSTDKTNARLDKIIEQTSQRTSQIIQQDKQTSQLHTTNIERHAELLQNIKDLPQSTHNTNTYTTIKCWPQFPYIWLQIQDHQRMDPRNPRTLTSTKSPRNIQSTLRKNCNAPTNRTFARRNIKHNMVRICKHLLQTNFNQGMQHTTSYKESDPSECIAMTYKHTSMTSKGWNNLYPWSTIWPKHDVHIHQWFYIQTTLRNAVQRPQLPYGRHKSVLESLPGTPTWPTRISPSILQLGQCNILYIWQTLTYTFQTTLLPPPIFTINFITFRTLIFFISQLTWQP